MLNFIDHSGPDNGPPLLIVHGLYGSARNWGLISKRISSSRRVIAVDLRNHGDSPWNDSHTYSDMAADLAEVIDHFGAPFDVMGHSMGGKAAMLLALNYPHLVNRLCIADIAPVIYNHDQSQFIKAMRSVDLSTIRARSDVKSQLSQHIENEDLQNFFVQSVDVKNQCWKLNLRVLDREMSKILGFPNVDTNFKELTLFLAGARSDYVKAEMRSHICNLFPAAKFAKIPRAGHWIHAERPRELEAALRVFFGYGA